VGTLHEDLHSFMLIPRLVLFRMRNVSDGSCRENQNRYFFDIQRTMPRDIFL